MSLIRALNPLTYFNLLMRLWKKRESTPNKEKQVFLGAMLHVESLQNSEARRSLLKTKFDGYLDGNAMKWMNLLDKTKSGYQDYDFSKAEQMLKFAEANGKRTMLHTLLWAKPSFFPVKRGYPITDRTARIMANTKHISKVVGHFRGRFDYIQVWNEPLEPKGKALKTFPGVEDITWEEIGINLRQAKTMDPQAKVGINDYNIEDYQRYQVKVNNYVKAIKWLKENGYPIDFIGCQTHIRAEEDVKESALRDAFKALKSTGVEVLITELDISIAGLTGMTQAEKLQKQAELAGRIYRAAKAEGVKEIWTWGLDDAESWLYAKNETEFPEEAPLMFGPNQERKPWCKKVKELGHGYEAW